MKNIVLACAAGMSTSLLVTKMRKAAEEKGIEVKIEAYPAQEAKKIIASEDVDCVMLGPQVKFMLSQFQEEFPNHKISIIDMRDYGLMNGEKVLEEALATIEGTCE